MNTPSAEHFEVHLTVDDARTAQAAGVGFARRLSGADAADFTLALTEQEHLIKHTIVEAGHNDDQARLAARYFATAARAEWAQITSAGGGGTWATA